MKKRFFLITMCVILVVSMLAGCTKPSSSDQKTKEIKIGISAADLSNPYFVQLINGVKDAAKEKKVTIIVDDPKSDVTKQATGIENFIASGVDAMIIMALDPKAIDPFAKQAKEKGIKVIAQSNMLDNCDLFVAADEYEMGHTLGIAAGNFIKEKLGGKAEVALLTYPMVPQIIDRANGIKKGIEEIAPDAVVVAEQTAGTPDQGMKATETILQAHPNVKVICGINDAGALGALSAVESAGKAADDFFIGGIDCTEEGLDKIKNKKVFRATVDTDPYNNGKLDLDFALKLINGESVPSPYRVKTKIADETNISDYSK